MKVTSAVFLKSAFAEEHWPPADLPEISFVGRSNVGKSSLINSLLGVKGLARASNTPGRTQALNFFDINQRFRLVDLPGYGFARVSKQMRAAWGQMAEEFLAKRANLVLSIQIVDSRHEPTKLDLQLCEWLRRFAKPHLLVATKSDKLSQNELRKNLARARRLLQTERLIAYSAVTGQGRAEVWQAVETALTSGATH
jgi:GTP-binding protein